MKKYKPINQAIHIGKSEDLKKVITDLGMGQKIGYELVRCFNENTTFKNVLARFVFCEVKNPGKGLVQYKVKIDVTELTETKIVPRKIKDPIAR